MLQFPLICHQLLKTVDIRRIQALHRLIQTVLLNPKQRFLQSLFSFLYRRYLRQSRMKQLRYLPVFFFIRKMIHNLRRIHLPLLILPI